MTYRAWNLKTLDRAAVRELTHAIAEQNTEELEYHSQSEEPWTEAQYNATLAAQQKETALLAARGITDPTEALTLLAGEEELTDPMLLTDMDKACARILQAIDNEETIVVFGDYDVDGVTATALLYQHLKGMGANVKCMLPSREGDGYGLSKNAIQSIHDKGCQLIVTVDNGIAAIEEAEFAASLGVDLIVTDHHLPHEVLPKAVAVVDPRRADDTSPFKGLCGAGVAFKLCAALDGCPPEEIERIATYLITEKGLNTYVKCKAMLEEMRDYLKEGDFSEEFVPSDYDADNDCLVESITYADEALSDEDVAEPDVKEEATEEKSEGNNMAAMAVGAVVIIGVCGFVLYRRKKA